jgi:plasmid maintenance system antidote protein VapI
MIEARKELGRLIAARMTFLGLTQLKLSKMTGLPQPTISNVINAKKDFKIDTYLRLCKVLDYWPKELETLKTK